MKLSTEKLCGRRDIIIEKIIRLFWDIAFTKDKIAIFCDGASFYGKDWKVLKPRLQKGKNPEYWVNKIPRNMTRDDEKDKQLLFLGGTVIHFWGKDIMKNMDECIRVIKETIFDIEMHENRLDDEYGLFD